VRVHRRAGTAWRRGDHGAASIGAAFPLAEAGLTRKWPLRGDRLGAVVTGVTIAPMQLQRFLPYRLAVLADAVSRATAAVYGRRFELSRDEWRLLAALGEAGRIQAAEAAQTTTLEKMQASRALRSLEARGLVARETDANDRRHVIVHLLPAGRALLRQLVPLVLEREAWLLEVLDADERAVLDRALAKLLERARALGDG
jgi:DNA-binding MarR family transcriptional regulator